MTETLISFFAFAVGMTVGMVFYGGLWWTIREAVSSPMPALWFAVSLPLRMIVALAGFYFIAGLHWERLLLCLLGFVIARILVTWLSGLPTEKHSSAVEESLHAP